MNIRFKKATLDYKDYIFDWLDKPHVKEFWDNSQEHRDDILIFMNGSNAPRPYFNGTFDYWVGLINDEPFALLMTSEIKNAETDLPEGWYEQLSITGKTLGIDFMIGNEKYLGKGLAAPTLEAFTQFIPKHIDPLVDRFLIDPAANNPRAKHVYKKAGFKVVSEFVRRDENTFLMVKKLK